VSPVPSRGSLPGSGKMEGFMPSVPTPRPPTITSSGKRANQVLQSREAPDKRRAKSSALSHPRSTTAVTPVRPERRNRVPARHLHDAFISTPSILPPPTGPRALAWWSLHPPTRRGTRRRTFTPTYTHKHTHTHTHEQLSPSRLTHPLVPGVLHLRSAVRPSWDPKKEAKRKR
jgi:hypothetical protein